MPLIPCRDHTERIKALEDQVARLIEVMPCQDHTTRIKALEDQVARLVEVMSGINNLSGEIIAKLEEKSLHREPDLSLEAYHR